jgi:hypothetical protein
LMKYQNVYDNWIIVLLLDGQQIIMLPNLRKYYDRNVNYWSRSSTERNQWYTLLEHTIADEKERESPKSTIVKIYLKSTTKNHEVSDNVFIFMINPFFVK